MDTPDSVMWKLGGGAGAEVLCSIFAATAGLTMVFFLLGTTSPVSGITRCLRGNDACIFCYWTQSRSKQWSVEKSLVLSGSSLIAHFERLERLKPAFAVESGHATRPRSRDCLAVNVILDISTCKNTFYVGIG